MEAQQNFVKFGACEQRFTGDVESQKQNDLKDPEWRPIIKDKDRILSWNNKADSELWQKNKDKETPLYYWRKDYWLKS